MKSKCEQCGELAVDDSENITVCKACGIVVDETIFSTNDYVPLSKSSTLKSFNQAGPRLYSNQKKKSISLEHGQTVLDNLCHINHIPLNFKTEITELFNLIASIRRFSKKEDAGTAAACCLFLWLRSNKQDIAIYTLCKQVSCTKKKFSHFLKFLKFTLSSNDKFKQYSFLLDNTVSDDKKNENKLPDIVPFLVREICEKAETEEKEQLIEKTTALVNLAYSCWLSTGRTPRSIVAAAACLCWKSMHPSRIKMPFTKFFHEFEIREPMAKYRIPEFKDLLLKLGEMIPSRTKNYVNRDNLLFHLNTILENSETLRNDLFPDSYTFDEVNAVEFQTFRYPPKNFYRRNPSLNAVHYASDMDASDIEILDSEIESYLVPEKKDIVEFVEKVN